MVYTVVTEASEEHLADTVNQLIENGWKPQGGVAVVNASAQFHSRNFTQAMIKED